MRRSARAPVVCHPSSDYTYSGHERPQRTSRHWAYHLCSIIDFALVFTVFGGAQRSRSSAFYLLHDQEASQRFFDLRHCVGHSTPARRSGKPLAIRISHHHLGRPTHDARPITHDNPLFSSSNSPRRYIVLPIVRPLPSTTATTITITTCDGPVQQAQAPSGAVHVEVVHRLIRLSETQLALLGPLPLSLTPTHTVDRVAPAYPSNDAASRAGPFRSW